MLTLTIPFLLLLLLLLLLQDWVKWRTEDAWRSRQSQRFT
tara:strand:- start:236 stop:355 length:120 start_codon:yes stop_codon:yes gene_type:complete